MVEIRSSQAADAMAGLQFGQALLDRGVLKAHESFFVSTAHDDDDIELTIEVVRASVAELVRRP